MKNITIFLAGLIAGMILGGVFSAPRKITQKEYVIHTVHDTITISRPAPVAVPETIRIESVLLESAQGHDSVAVHLPITSVLYTGDGYRARVSGFRPALDSLIIDRVTITRQPKPKRWALGIQTGVAATPRGVQPFVGIGITYKLIEF